MKCPYCRIDNDRVIDSRASEDGFAIRRRRECASCGRRYNTNERIEELNIKVVKTSGSREPFRREKIRRGLVRACSKRPIADDTIDAIVAELETQIYDEVEGEVESRRIGELVLEHLAGIDDVALVRFASVYRRFNDITDFLDQLRPMLKEKRSSRSPSPALTDAETD